MIYDTARHLRRTSLICAKVARTRIATEAQRHREKKRKPLFAFLCASVSLWRIAILFLLTGVARAELPTMLPATPPSGLDPALWARMTKIDAKAGQIIDLSADFEQKKFTPLMKKPLVSTGTVLAKGAAMRWDTKAPEPTVMRVDEKEVTLYYPNQKTVEIYPIGGQLSSLRPLPLSRL